MFIDFKFSEFPNDKGSTAEFPPRGDSYVYVVFCKRGGLRTPIYVGQTIRLSERVGDYMAASFAAPTDFKVGEAIKYIRSRKHGVEIAYKKYKNSREEERKLIRRIQLSGLRLLNDFGSYKYQAADRREQELHDLQRFCGILLGEAPLIDMKYPIP